MSSSSSSSSTTPQLLHEISILKLFQITGPIVISGGYIESTFDFVVLLQGHVVEVYGLSGNPYVISNGERFQVYVKTNSAGVDIRSNGDIYEKNGTIPRSQFSAPSKRFAIPSHIYLRISQIEMKGSSQLSQLSQEYLSESVSCVLSDNAILKCGLAIKRFSCVMKDSSQIYTRVKRPDGSVLRWSLEYLTLEMEPTCRVRGIDVTSHYIEIQNTVWQPERVYPPDVTMSTNCTKESRSYYFVPSNAPDPTPSYIFSSNISTASYFPHLQRFPSGGRRIIRPSQMHQPPAYVSDYEAVRVAIEQSFNYPQPSSTPRLRLDTKDTFEIDEATKTNIKPKFQIENINNYKDRDDEILRDCDLCTVCFMKAARVVVSPCLDKILCISCAETAKFMTDKCYKCRTHITSANVAPIDETIYKTSFDICNYNADAPIPKPFDPTVDNEPCSLCQINVADVVLGCGHSSFCIECAVLERKKQSKCPKCSKSIKNAILINN